MTTGLQLSLLGQERSQKAHPAEFERCRRIAMELARKDTGRGITVSDVRKAAGLFQGDGKSLSFLGGVMRAAGLKPTGEYRRSDLDITHANAQRVWTGER